MNKEKLLKHLVFLMFFIFFTNSIILKFHWYYSIWWIDILMHFLGGFWVGGFFLYVFIRKKTRSESFIFLAKVVLATLAVGLVWEIYEFYIYQYLSQNPFDLIDTISDLFFNILGSIISFFYLFKIIIPTPLNKVQ